MNSSITSRLVAGVSLSDMGLWDRTGCKLERKLDLSPLTLEVLELFLSLDANLIAENAFEITLMLSASSLEVLSLLLDSVLMAMFLSLASLLGRLSLR